MAEPPRTAQRIAVLYTLFATFSIAVNLGAQMLSMFLYRGPYAVPLSIVVGTAAGMPLRYLLEKRFIFGFQSRDLAHDGRLFVLYGIMGVATTLVFWVTEYLFELIFRTDAMRYLGGVIGLAIGFYVKYRLDKKYVFVGDARCATA